MKVVEWAIGRELRDGEVLSAVRFTTHAGDRTVEGRLRHVRELYPADLVFVHRDAESRDSAPRYEEIDGGREAATWPVVSALIPIVPVQASEAWLLFDAAAIRRAADKPTGTASLSLPRLSAIERVADPKSRLSEALKTAHASSARRRAAFERELATRRGRVAELIDDFAPLLVLPAFKRFVGRTAAAVERWRTDNARYS